MITKLFSFLFLFAIFSPKIEACSTFLLENKDQPLLAKSFDWIVEDGLVVVNKRSIAKKAMTLDHPLEWISQYGSITFTQAGRELPMGGMNETGLAIELMWLDATAYPAPDSRATVNELQWIQYQLDTAKSVEEVIKSDYILRIDPNAKALLHFIVLDSTGNCAMIEFIDGKTIVHTRDQMIVPVLTNNTYEKSLEYLKEHQGFGGNKPLSQGHRSLDRFVRISSLLKNTSENKDPFQILSHVANFDEASKEKISFENMEKSNRTMWNIVYDVSNKEIHFLTKSKRDIRTIRLNAFEFEGNTEVKILDIQDTRKKDMSSHFSPYTYESNRNLIDSCYDQTPFLRNLPTEIRELSARYPDSTYYSPSQE